MSNTKVMAVVLTYHAPEALANCVQGIAAQSRPPDSLLVVDNTGSPLPAASPPAAGRIPLRVLRTGENLGPAGGHAQGLKAFVSASSMTHAWVMDDDCMPEPNVLKELLGQAEPLPEASIVFPTWFNGVEDRIQNAPAWCGFLISRQAVERAGLPREELFWWTEDTEYLKFRMSQKGVAKARAEGAVVWHWPSRRLGTRPPWRTYYEVRNATWYRLHVQRTRDAYRRLARTLIRIFAASLRHPPRRASLAALVHGLRDGIRGRLGRTVLPPLPATITESADQNTRIRQRLPVSADIDRPN